MILHINNFNIYDNETDYNRLVILQYQDKK